VECEIPRLTSVSGLVSTESERESYYSARVLIVTEIAPCYWLGY